jgi:hypothetical protein
MGQYLGDRRVTGDHEIRTDTNLPLRSTLRTIKSAVSSGQVWRNSNPART